MFCAPDVSLCLSIDRVPRQSHLLTNSMLSNIVSAAFTVTMQCVSYPRMRTHNQMCVHARRQAEWPKIFAERKADIESAAKAEGVMEYEEARKKKKEEEAKAAKDSKKAKSKA